MWSLGIRICPENIRGGLDSIRSEQKKNIYLKLFIPQSTLSWFTLPLMHLKLLVYPFMDGAAFVTATGWTRAGFHWKWSRNWRAGATRCMQLAEYLLHTDVFPGSDLSDIQLEKVQSPKASLTFTRASMLNMWFQCFHTFDVTVWQ